MQQKVDEEGFRSTIGDDIGKQSDMNCLSGSTFMERLTADCLASSVTTFLVKFMFASRAFASAGCGNTNLS